MQNSAEINEEEKIKENNNNHKIKGFAIFLSEFTFMIIPIIIMLIGIIFPSDHETTTYTSKEGPSWNSSSDPLIFTHLSDIHVKSLEDIDQFRDQFRAAKQLRANIHLLTGDYADDYKKKHFPKIGKQNTKDWKYFQELLETELYNETILDVAGNHDMFGVISPLKKDFGYLDVSKSFTRNNTKTLKDFWVKTVKVEGMNFILVNPYNFPTVHPPYGYYPHPTKKLLDLLESEINKVGTCSILTHYPIDYFWWKKNKNGHTFGKIMKNENVQFIFTGHTHPGKFRIKHHIYGGLEFIGTATIKTHDLGIVTIDNGRLVYNLFDFKKNISQSYFMTYPVPKMQLSKSHNFNEMNTEIRIISYKSEIEDNLYIKGDFSGKLEYQRDLKNGAKLYSMPLNIKNSGDYEITFKTPGNEINRKFYVGKKVKIYGERKDLYKAFFRLLIASIMVLLLFLLIIVFPIRFINLSFIDDWILGNNEGKCYYYILCICLCPFILNYRICTNAPIYFRIILIFFLCYPLVLPFHFFEPIKGYIGYSFFCFYLIKGKVIYDEWSIFFNAFYFWLIISPVALFVSGFKFKKTCFYVFHFVFVYFCFACVCFVNFRWAGESVKLWLLFFHPCYIIIPIILNIFLYIILNRYDKLQQQQNENEDSNITDIKNNENNGTIITIKENILDSVKDKKT